MFGGEPEDEWGFEDGFNYRAWAKALAGYPDDDNVCPEDEMLGHKCRGCVRLALELAAARQEVEQQIAGTVNHPSPTRLPRRKLIEKGFRISSLSGG